MLGTATVATGSLLAMLGLGYALPTGTVVPVPSLSAASAGQAEVPADATQQVDVFIGDSSATNFTSGTTKDNRWTALLSRADGVTEISEAVSGTGFVVGSVPFDKQVDKVGTRLQEAGIPKSAVRRVFVVGGGNDMAQVKAGKVTQDEVTAAFNEVMPRIAKAFPDSQLVYFPEVSPMNSKSNPGLEAMLPYMDSIYALARSYGFSTGPEWTTFVPDADLNGTVAVDGGHLNPKGHNVAANAIVRYLDGLGGEKVPYGVAAWPSGDVTEATTWSTGSVTLYTNDGTGSKSVSTALNAYSGQTVTLPDAPARDGYSFVGWNDREDGSGTSYAAGGQVTVHGSMSLYATWKEDAPKPDEDDGTMLATKPHAAPALPAEVDGKTVQWDAVTGSRNSYNSPYSIVEAGGVDASGARVSRDVLVLPKDVTYLIDAGTDMDGANAHSEAHVIAKKANPQLLNASADGESGDAGTWGRVGSGYARHASTTEQGLYSAGIENAAGIEYRLSLKAGKWALDTGFFGWDKATGTLSVSVSDTSGKVLASGKASLVADAQSRGDTLRFETDGDETMTVRVTGRNARLSWLAVASDYAAPVTDVDYSLSYSKTPTDDQRDAYARIVAAMDDAVDRWNRWNAKNPGKVITMHLKVSYEPGVATADAKPDYALNMYGWRNWGPGDTGTIRFGSNRDYMVEGTALHEIGHVMGSGYFQYGSLLVGGTWTGEHARAKVKEYDGAAAELHGGGSHIWPYGNNYATEWENAPEGYKEHMDRVVEVFAALHEDVVDPSPRFAVLDGALAGGKVGIAYDQRLGIAGQSNQGNAITVEVAGGNLPDGVALDATDRDANGKENLTDDRMYIHLKGTPTKAGTYEFTLKATNANGRSEQKFAITVAGNGTGEDGNQNQNQGGVGNENENQGGDQNQNGNANTSTNENADAGESPNNDGNHSANGTGNVMNEATASSDGEDSASSQEDKQPDTKRDVTRDMAENREKVMSQTGDGTALAMLPMGMGALLLGLTARTVASRKDRK